MYYACEMASSISCHEAHRSMALALDILRKVACTKRTFVPAMQSEYYHNNSCAKLPAGDQLDHQTLHPLSREWESE